MKTFLVTIMFLSMGLFAQTPGTGTQGPGLSPNNRKTPSVTFTSRQGMGEAAPSSSKTTTVVSARGSQTMRTSANPVLSGSGVTTDQMNTSPHEAPTTDAEARRDATFSSREVFDTGPYTREGTFDPETPDEIQAQEENALDYSTTPKKRTTTPMGPNKK